MLVRVIRHCMVEIVSWLNVQYYRLMGITIGKGCFISIRAHVDIRRGKITIGNNVGIASGSYILGHSGFRRIIEGQETKLEDNVKVFVNSVILPGVTVGKNSIVGAGSVVTQDVPPNVLVMGNPARVLQRLKDKKT